MNSPQLLLSNANLRCFISLSRKLQIHLEFWWRWNSRKAPFLRRPLLCQTKELALGFPNFPGSRCPHSLFFLAQLGAAKLDLTKSWWRHPRWWHPNLVWSRMGRPGEQVGAATGDIPQRPYECNHDAPRHHFGSLWTSWSSILSLQWPARGFHKVHRLPHCGPDPKVEEHWPILSHYLFYVHLHYLPMCYYLCNWI